MAQNLAAKYRPQTLDEIVGQEVVVNIVKNMCEADDLTNRNLLFIGPAGTGKAQPLDSKVLTTTGYKLMRDIVIGDEVFTSLGNRGKVSGIFPQGKRPIYKITLQDRTFIKVSDEHLNIFYRYNEDRKCRQDYCMTTKEMIKFFETSRFKLRMDLPVVDWEQSELPIDPYLLGVLIGDGSLSSGNLAFSNNELDIVEKVDSILRRDWSKMLKKIPGDNVDYAIVDVNHASARYRFFYAQYVNITGDELRCRLIDEGYPSFDVQTLVKFANGQPTNIEKYYSELVGKIKCNIDPNYRDWKEGDPFRNALRELDLCHKAIEKHIPKMYLLASKEVRLQLLQGLYDTDGCTGELGTTSFSTCSPQLSEDFAFLVRSLGIRDTISSFPSKYKQNGNYIYTGTTSYEHNMKIPNELVYCSSQKHLSRRTIRQNPPLRNITSIEYLGDEECQCLLIDHPDHTYISDDFIPTHNTTTARAIANILNEGKGEPIEVDAASHSGVDSVRELISQMRAWPVGTKYKTFILDECHAFSSNAWQALLKTLEEQPARTIVCLATTNPEKIPATILSRVQTFQLSKISLDKIHDRLKYIVQQENAEGRNIICDDAALLYIAKLCNGGMRDAITDLDQVLSYSNNVTVENVMKALSLPNYDEYFDLLNAIAKRDNGLIVKIINNVYNSGVNFVKWFDGFFSFVTNIVKFIYLQDINQTMIPSIYQDKIKGYGPAHSALCLKLSNKLVKLNQELKTTQYLQELAISYLCTAPVVKKG